MSENFKKTLSIVISAFNEEGNIAPLYQEIMKVLPELNLEKVDIIFVNDASTDNTLQEIKKIQSVDANVKTVNLLHNAGHEIAMIAGMDCSNTDAIVFMDADLQHPPAYLIDMVEKWRDGADIVLTKRLDNEETSKVYKFMAGCFYKVINCLSDVEIPENYPDFRLIDKKYVKFLKQFRERDGMFRSMLYCVMPDKNVEVIEFVAPKRYSGESKYNFRKSLGLALSAITQMSVKPLRLSVYLGLIAAFFALILGVYVFAEYWMLEKPTPGYATLMTTVVFIGAVQLIVLGIIGEYIGKISKEIKKRPLYMADIIERDTENGEYDN